jgi:uncharacterized protein DUF6502
MNRKSSHRRSHISAARSKATALRLARATFEGLAPLLIEHGVTSPEVEALLRAVCVHAAAKGQSTARRPNLSRVSVKTGVDRHLVAALLRSPPDGEGSATSRRDAVSRVIDGWLSDPEYTENGAPRDLDIGGPNTKGRTVWSLAQRYAPGVWPRLIVDELIRVDYVDTLPGGQLRHRAAARPELKRRSHRESTPALIRDAVQALLTHAVRSDGKSNWRTARSLEIDEQDMPVVRKMLRERLNTMFGWITDELNSARWQHNATGNPRIRVGVSGFMFEEILPKDAGNDKVNKPSQTKT